MASSTSHPWTLPHLGLALHSPTNWMTSPGHSNFSNSRDSNTIPHALGCSDHHQALPVLSSLRMVFHYHGHRSSAPLEWTPCSFHSSYFYLLYLFPFYHQICPSYLSPLTSPYPQHSELENHQKYSSDDGLCRVFLPPELPVLSLGEGSVARPVLSSNGALHQIHLSGMGLQQPQALLPPVSLVVMDPKGMTA